jgi:ABC-type ATPase involved in cell division
MCDEVKNLQLSEVTLSESTSQAERQIESGVSGREMRRIVRKLRQLQDNAERVTREKNQTEDKRNALRETLWLMLSGKDAESAFREGREWVERERSYPTVEEAGAMFYAALPVFTFFEDFSSLLPNRIDLEDLLHQNRQAEGYKAAHNFLTLSGLDASFFHEKNHRILKQKIENLNSDITVDFQDYWRQHVGNNDKIRLVFELEHYDHSVPGKSGKPYIEFWIKDKQERLYPKQRSRGVRWFLSFYLELKATARVSGRIPVLLIDEPGLSLHARAQEDVLKVFEDLKKELQIIYCTHSPHLIDIRKLYRIMAVQRANEGDGSGETRVLDARKFSSASADTLAPVYALMGTRLSENQLLPEQNVIVPDIVNHCYLDALLRMKGTKAVHLIPASGTVGIPVLANLLTGWKIGFGVLGFDNPTDKEMVENMNLTIGATHTSNAGRMKICKGFAGVEDLFSILDFKRFVLNERVGITETPSAYIRQNNLSSLALASGFSQRTQDEKLNWNDFDDETRQNMDQLMDLLLEIATPVR